jgi:hypothetical protein
METDLQLSLAQQIADVRARVGQLTIESVVGWAPPDRHLAPAGTREQEQIP